MANNMGGIQNIFNMLGGTGGTGGTVGNIFSGLRKILGINNTNGNNTNNGNRGQYSNYRCRYKIITMEEAYITMMAGGSKILDVRSENEYKVLRIKGAINIPIDMLCNNACSIIPNRQDYIIVYCSTGNRAARAIQVLSGLGYTNLCMWEGGGINNFKYKDMIINNVQIDEKNN